MKLKSTRVLLLIVLLVCCSCENYGVPFPRFYWNFNFKNVFVQQLCKSNGTYANCFKVSEEVCKRDLTKAVDQCIDDRQPYIPAVVIMPSQGRKLGRTLGKCAGDKYSQKYNAQYSEDELCRSGLQAITGEDPAEVRYKKWVANNPVLAVLVEIDTDKKNEIYSLAIKQGVNQKMDVNASLNEIIAEVQTKFLSSTPNAEYIDYARARLARNLALQEINPLVCHQIMYGKQLVTQKELEYALDQVEPQIHLNLHQSLKQALRAGAKTPVPPDPPDVIESSFAQAIEGMPQNIRDSFESYTEVPSAEGCRVSNAYYQSLLSLPEEKAAALLRFQALQ